MQFVSNSVVTVSASETETYFILSPSVTCHRNLCFSAVIRVFFNLSVHKIYIGLVMNVLSRIGE